MRHIDSDVNFSPVYRDSVRGSISVLSRGSGGSTASEALTDFVAPLLEGPEEESREGGRSPRLGAREKLEKIGREMEVVEEEEEEGKSSLVLLISSDDRLEVTLSPGAVETLLKIMEVWYGIVCPHCSVETAQPTMNVSRKRYLVVTKVNQNIKFLVKLLPCQKTIIERKTPLLAEASYTIRSFVVSLCCP